MRPVGLTSGQFSLLMALNRPQPPALGPVAALLAMDRTTLTANLKPLERRGLVETRSDRDDRRSRLLVITDAGRRVLAEALPIWTRTHAEVDTTLGDVDGTQLRAGLRAVA